jgi:two-component system cell cycle sensor histidine kinase/response regulator CckA
MIDIKNFWRALKAETESPSHARLANVAIRTSMVYWVLAFIWILFSDRAVMLFSMKPDIMVMISTYKGWAFVTVTAFMLFFSLRNQLRRWEVETEKRQEVEKELSRYELLANHSRDLILFVRKNDGRLIEANVSATNAYGYTREELLALSITDIRAPGYKTMAPSQMEEADAHGILFETVHARKNGETFPVEVSSQGIDLDGTRILISVIREITDRKRAEEQLLIKDFAIESSISAIGLADMNGKVFYVNDAFVKLWGYSNADELLGRDISEFSQSPGRITDAIAVMKSGKGYLSESKGMRRNNTIFDFQISANIVKSKEGNPLCLMASFIDITERKAAEKSLQNAYDDLERSEEKYRSLFEQSKDAIFISEDGGSITDVNPAGLELLGFDEKNELLKENMGDLFADPEDRKSFFEVLRREKFVKDREFRFIRKGKEEIIVNSTTSAILDESKDTLSFLSIVRNITKQKAIQQQLAQAQRMESVGTLAAGIAHDFNNILGIIMGHSTHLEMAGTEPGSATRSVDSIQKATARGAALVNQLLTFARKTESVYEQVRVNDVVDEVSRLLKETLPKTITVLTDLKTDLPPLNADATQINQVLLNLCVNARDAMPAGGNIKITTDTVDSGEISLKFPTAAGKEYIVMKVSDSGIGMDEETRRRIFDPFFTTKDIGKGTGLGLALVHSIVTNHGGFVDVETELGKGTTFSIYLPVTEGKILENPPPPLSFNEAPGGEETILLIEDEDMFVSLASEVLASKGYKVLTASDGEAGLKLFTTRQNDIDIVISDLGLPKLSGDEVLLKIRSIAPLVKLIAASGYIDSDTRVKLVDAGVNHFVQKPYMFAEILKTIRQAIEE